MKKKFLCIVALSATIMGCTDHNRLGNVSDPQDAYKDKQAELVVYSNYPQVINYKVARYLAYQELAGGMDQFIDLPADYELAKFPRIVYDYDNFPKYYEFDVIAGGNVVGTVTTYAQKEDNCVIAYLFEGQREEIHTDHDAYVGDYPSLLYGKKLSPGSRIDLLVDAENRKVNTANIIYAPANDDPWAGQYAMTEYMDEENRLATLAAIEEMKQSPEYLELVEQESHTTEYWEQMEPLANEIANTPDDDINRSFRLVSSVSTQSKDKDDGPDPNGITGQPAKWMAIDAYNNENLKKTRRKTYCGPGAVAWAFRGLFNTYPISGSNAKKIEIHPFHRMTDWMRFNMSKEKGHYASYYCFDDQEDLLNIYNKRPNNPSRLTDNGFTEKLYDHTKQMKFISTDVEYDYPMFELGLKNAFKAITNGQYKVVNTTASRAHIEKKKLPVFINYTERSGQQHWIVAFGSGSSGTKKYIYVADNGSLTKGFGYKAFWKKETTANYGLRYKVVKQ